MTVKTRVVELRRDAWQQLCDGTQNVFVQVLNGSVEYVVADSTPSADTLGNVMRLYENISFTSPTQVWARAGLSAYHAARITLTPND